MFENSSAIDSESKINHREKLQELLNFLIDSDEKWANINMLIVKYLKSEDTLLWLSQKVELKFYVPNVHTITASRSFGSSCRYFTTHVMTLAVVSRAAKSTPIMLSAIWSSDKVSPPSPFQFSKQLKRSLSSSFFSLLSHIISLRILPSLFLACIWIRMCRVSYSHSTT